MVNKSKSYFIKTEHVPSGQISVDIESKYDSIDKAQQFLTEVESCVLYDDYFGNGTLGNESKDGLIGAWFKNVDDEKPLYVYMIKELK